MSLTACFDAGDGTYRLGSATDVVCFSNQHIPYMVLSIILIVFYVIPFPFLIYFLLRRLKNKDEVGLDHIKVRHRCHCAECVLVGWLVC